jgi:phenylpropionate dioxygenase-like ring-hydroxylating dioxygenase large terminal subunit
MSETASRSGSAGVTEVGVALSRTRTHGHDDAWTMPKAFYADEQVLDIERRELFAKEWICIGRVDEVANPGDFMTFQLCDEPLVAVRGDDLQIRVLSNVCRHRGALIANGSGNGSHLLCPYHHWSYQLDGQLARTPRLDDHASFDRTTCRLPEFATEQWMGFLFVCLAADPAPLAPRLAGLESMIRNYHMEQMAARVVADEVWPTNWKCFVENFMEGYHLTPLHHATLHPVNPTRLCRHYEPGDAYFGYHAGFSPDLPRSEKGHPDLSEAEVDDCVMFSIPPGLVSGCAGDYSSFICVQPEGVGKVRLKVGLLFYGNHWTDQSIDHAWQLFLETNAEDREVLTAMTRGLASNHHQTGPLAGADFEGAIHDFHSYLDRRLAAAMAAVEHGR